MDRQAHGAPAAYAYYRWIRQAVAENRPFDRFARELITAEGPLAEVPAAAFYKAVPKPGEAANTLAQAFMGVRVACAECHHHPFDRWGQTDYYGMAAFLSPIGVARSGRPGEVSAQVKATASISGPGQPCRPRRSAEKAVAGTGDQREALAPG